MAHTSDIAFAAAIAPNVWAMGGQPRYALNLAFFANEQLPIEVLHAILRGGARMCAEAGVAVVGGHTVCDPEVKFGLAVTGEVDPAAVLSNRGASAGQVLVLTKALGTGVVCQAIKAGVATAAEQAAAVRSMTTLNRDGLAIARRHGVSALTDVTGFGLCGHLRNLLRGSELTATIDLAALPLLPGALDHLAAGRHPGGSQANRSFMASRLRRSDDGSVTGDMPPDPDDTELRISLACDAQTSGGLLLCLPPDRAAACVAELRAAGLPASMIGTLVAPTEARPIEMIVVA